MKGNRFETIRWTLWLGIFVVLTLAGCGPSAVTPTPTMAPATATVTKTAPATTPTATVPPTSDVLVITPVPPKSPTASPVVQYNTPTLEPTQTPIPTFLAACPTPILASSIIHRDNDTGWRHYWASSSQKVGVNDLLVDGKWLWIATTDGVIRLDQRTLDYELFSQTGGDSFNLTLNRIYTLAVDDQGRLWAGGWPGLARYSDDMGWKVIYTLSYSVNDFALDTDGNLWFWIQSDPRWRPTAYRFQGQEPPAVGDWKPERVGSQDSNLEPSDWRLLAVKSRNTPSSENIKDGRGNTWSWSYDNSLLTIYRNGRVAYTVHVDTVYSSYDIAVAEAGIWIGLGEGLFYGDGQTLKKYRFAAGKAMIDTYPRVYDLAFTADGKGWATTSQGLFHFSEKVEKWEEITELSITMPFEEEEIGLVASDQRNSLWAYSNDYLAYFDGQSWLQWTIPNRVRKHWWDRETAIEYQDDLWLPDVTNRCLWHFDGQTWGNIRSPEIRRLAQDRNERLYATDYDDSVLVYDGMDWQRLPDCAECGELNLPGAISVDATGKVWVAYKSGIWRYSSDQGWCKILALDPHAYVGSLLIDAYDDLWTSNGSREVLHCNQENCEAWTFGDDLPFYAPITAMAMDPKGRIWVGGWGLLSVYDPAAER